MADTASPGLWDRMAQMFQGRMDTAKSAFSSNPTEEATRNLMIGNVLGKLAAGYDKSIGGTGAIGEALSGIYTNALYAGQQGKRESAINKPSSLLPSNPAGVGPLDKALDGVVAPGVPGVVKPPIPALASPPPAPMLSAPPVSTPNTAAPAPTVTSAPQNGPVDWNTVRQMAMGDYRNPIVPDYPVLAEEVGFSGMAGLPIEAQQVLANVMLKGREQADVAASNANAARADALSRMMTGMETFAPYNLPIADASGLSKMMAVGSQGGTRELGNTPAEWKATELPTGVDRTGGFMVDTVSGKTKKVSEGSKTKPAPSMSPYIGLETAKIKEKNDALQALIKFHKDSNYTLNEKGKKVPLNPNRAEVVRMNELAAANDIDSRLSVLSAPKDTTFGFGDPARSVVYMLPSSIYTKMQNGVALQPEESRARIDAMINAMMEKYDLSEPAAAAEVKRALTSK